MTTAGLARARRGAAAVAALMLGAGVAGAAIAPSASATSAANAAPSARAAMTQAGGGCGKATGPFTVSGTQVRAANGQNFVSYGITVPGLQGMNWTRYVSLDLEKITATAENWCANTVRLQLNQDDLLGANGTGFNPVYMLAVEDEVSLAESDHLVVVLNDETNFGPSDVQNFQRGPTPATETFWKDLARVYGQDPQVIFDLFNEPRTYSSGMPEDLEWQLWLHGGWFDGVYYPFGMAGLASYVRDTLGARNLLWIEGPNWSMSFAGMVQQHALVHVGGVIYALHHPAGQPGTASWEADFGYLVTDGVAPVVDGEWTNYEPKPTASPTWVPSSCWPDAPAAVPEFFQYLTAHGIGLNAYQLQPGFLIKSYRDLARPTTINAKTWSCQPGAEMQPGQGAGAEVLKWFEQRNG